MVNGRNIYFTFKDVDVFKQIKEDLINENIDLEIQKKIVNYIEENFKENFKENVTEPRTFELEDVKPCGDINFIFNYFGLSNSAQIQIFRS